MIKKNKEIGEQSKSIGEPATEHFTDNTFKKGKDLVRPPAAEVRASGWPNG